jgi:hypothetical protein
MSFITYTAFKPKMFHRILNPAFYSQFYAYVPLLEPTIAGLAFLCLQYIKS